MLTVPPTKDPSAATTRARRARPLRAIACPWRHVIVEDGSPGRLMRIAVTDLRALLKT